MNFLNFHFNGDTHWVTLSRPAGLDLKRESVSLAFHSKDADLETTRTDSYLIPYPGFVTKHGDRSRDDEYPRWRSRRESPAGGKRPDKENAEETYDRGIIGTFLRRLRGNRSRDHYAEISKQARTINGRTHVPSNVRERVNEAGKERRQDFVRFSLFFSRRRRFSPSRLSRELEGENKTLATKMTVIARNEGFAAEGKHWSRFSNSVIIAEEMVEFKTAPRVRS